MFTNAFVFIFLSKLNKDQTQAPGLLQFRIVLRDFFTPIPGVTNCHRAQTVNNTR